MTLEEGEPFKPPFIKEERQLTKPESGDPANTALLRTVCSKDIWEFICI